MSILQEHRVFVTYSRRDIEQVDRLVRRLIARGISVMTDLNDISLGEDWKERLQQLISDADTILFVITPASMASEICAWEVEFAESQGKRILPVLLKPVADDIIPARLARLQYLVLTDERNDRAFGTLIDAIFAGAKYGHGAKDDKVFVSYRRAETAHVAGRIFDHLEREFGEGRVFFDVEGIPLGVDFREHIRQAILSSTALIAVIGKRWASRFAQRSALFGIRQHRGIDFVRIEIELAIEHNVRIMPLLVDGTEMPAEHKLPAKISQICYFQAAPIRAGLDFRADMARVLSAIKTPVRHAIV